MSYVLVRRKVEKTKRGDDRLASPPMAFYDSVGRYASRALAVEAMKEQLGGDLNNWKTDPYVYKIVSGEDWVWS